LQKIIKLAQLLRHRVMARMLLQHRVAATTEHIEALAFFVPAGLLDVGANKGQFSIAARAIVPDVVIHAFEPLASAADQFATVFAGDAHTTLHRVAIGAREGEAVFYVANRQDSSSLLKPGAGQIAAFGVEAETQITVDVRTIESMVALDTLPRPLLLKIDVQGTELDVLLGIKRLDLIDAVYVEMSFMELYEAQSVFDDVYMFLREKGFSLRGVFNQASTRRFGPTQADCLFVRNVDMQRP